MNISKKAPGIPDLKKIKPIPKLDKPTFWEYVLHRHLADKAGPHYDFRLKDNKNAHSFVVKHGLPTPGERRLAIMQPTHHPSFLKFQGILGKGYGKGRISIDQKGLARILAASPDFLHLALLDKRDPEEFIMAKRPSDFKKNDWYIINVTPTRKSKPNIPNARPKYKNAKPTELEKFLSEDYAAEPKIDGAHVIWDLSGTRPRIYSYRPSQRSDRLIQHTFKVPGIDTTEVPKGIKGTILRGEIYGEDKNKNVIPAQELGAILNSNTQNALQRQSEQGVTLKNMIFDVVKYKGRDVENIPYKNKLSILKSIAKIFPGLFKVPEIAIDAKDKKRMLKQIMEGKHKDTKEGLVIWPLKKGKRPIKMKIRPDYDIYIRNIFPSKKPNEAGGFEYSLTPKGRIIGHVGTGFSRNMKQDMLQNPHKYLGRVATVTALDQFPSGALRAPAFERLHIEK